MAEAAELQSRIVELALEQTLGVMYEISRLGSEQRMLHTAVFMQLFGHFSDTVKLAQFHRLGTIARTALITQLRRQAMRRIGAQDNINLARDAMLVADCATQMLSATTTATEPRQLPFESVVQYSSGDGRCMTQQ